MRICCKKVSSLKARLYCIVNLLTEDLAAYSEIWQHPKKSVISKETLTNFRKIASGKPREFCFCCQAGSSSHAWQTSLHLPRSTMIIWRGISLLIFFKRVLSWGSYSSYEGISCSDDQQWLLRDGGTQPPCQLFTVIFFLGGCKSRFASLVT